MSDCISLMQSIEQSLCYSFCAAAVLILREEQKIFGLG
jgi:hypothetical protein